MIDEVHGMIDEVHGMIDKVHGMIDKVDESSCILPKCWRTIVHFWLVSMSPLSCFTYYAYISDVHSVQYMTVLAKYI